MEGFRSKHRWAILISGRGSNLSAAIDEPGFDVRLVLSNRADAPGISRARRSGVPVESFPTMLNKNGKHQLNWSAAKDLLTDYKIQGLLMLGFMRVVPATFINQWVGPFVNLHPSLLPKYPGLNSFERAYADGASCGVSLHEVIPELDAGAVLGQRTTLAGDQIQAVSLDQARFWMSIDEQRAVREFARLQ